MDRGDRFLNMDPTLLDASQAEWLPVDGAAASPNAKADKREAREQREDQVRRALVGQREKQRALANATGTSPRLPTQQPQITGGSVLQRVSGDAAPLLGVLGTGAGCPAVMGPPAANNVADVRLTDATASLPGAMVTLPDLAAALPNPTAAFIAAADRTESPTTTAGADAGPSETTSPSISLTATATGSSTPTSPTVQNVSTCCGTCGYVNCPMQLMTQTPVNGAKLSGQIYGSGSPGAADATSQKNILGASISQS